MTEPHCRLYLTADLPDHWHLQALLAAVRTWERAHPDALLMVWVDGCALPSDEGEK
jgi:hypothetical protein